MTNSKQPFAVFDIDGTLYRWQLFHAITKELVDTGAIDDCGELENSWANWRGNAIDFEDYERVLVKNILFKNLKGLKTADFEEAAKSVIDRTWFKVYRYTQNLLSTLKKRGYLIIAISGSQQELLDLFCARYGFDVAIGALYERKDGLFTGKVLRSTYETKGELLNKLVEARDLTWEGSVAIGDTKSDIPILDLVERPIAFNPNGELLEKAQKNNWKIVIERKNIVYEFNGENNGQLILAKTSSL